MNQKEKEIIIENTKFIFATNFKGDPEKNGLFGGTDRRCNIVIPTQELADACIEAGLEVSRYEWVDKDTGETKSALFLPNAKVAYRNRDGSEKKRKPMVYLSYNYGEPVLQDENTIGDIDEQTVLSVDVTINPWYYDVKGKWYPYVNVMYVVCDAIHDPFAAKYHKTTIAPDENYFAEED